MNNTSRIFYINSRDRLNATSSSNSDFQINLDFSGLDATHACVLQAYIPKSFYNVPAGRNSLTLNENGTEYTITLTPGNYNLTNLISSLSTALNASGSWTYSLSTPSDPQTGKIVFSVAGNASIQPILTFTEYLWEAMGFEENTSYSFSSDALTSPNVVNLAPESTVYIKSDLIQDTENVLQEIFSVNNLAFSGIQYQNMIPDLYKKRLISKTSSGFRFYIVDENNNPLVLNGGNVVMSILVWKPIDKRKALTSIIKRQK